MAAVNEGFKAELIKDRKRALCRRGFRLSNAELATINSVSDRQLQAMIERIQISTDTVKKSGIMRSVAATITTIALGAGIEACGSSSEASRENIEDAESTDKVELPVCGYDPSWGQRPGIDCTPSKDNENRDTLIYGEEDGGDSEKKKR
ncbi:MAG: hypothetical protein GY854_33435 [Deltaproteobacteria bacterium]|nr:hypothetical protein [Deltaproteobacteria bacterium]